MKSKGKSKYPVFIYIYKSHPNKGRLSLNSGYKSLEKTVGESEKFCTLIPFGLSLELVEFPVIISTFLFGDYNLV